VALSFLIWGGVGDAPPGRGALVPGSVGTFPANTHSVDQIRQRYKPLLFVLARAWPGFMHALLVHLVDSCLSIEATADAMDAGAIRKLYFLSSWIRFALSRDFHRCHDRSLSVMKGADDLGKRAVSTWKLKERAFMEGPAPLNILHGSSFPLNSLGDRCRECKGRTSQVLAALFDSVLGNERSDNFGVDIGNGSSGVERSPSEEANMTVTLEEMDTLLSCREQHQAEDSASGPTNEAAIVRQLGWTLCLSWDPCAIGSLPGRPV
jgi:hypothetical protein